MRSHPHDTAVARLKQLERQKQIQQKSEAVFKRLMVSFVQFLGDKNADDSRLLAHISKLNDQWVKHCSKVKEMTPEGKDELMKHINKALEDLPINVTLGHPPDSPSQEN